MTPFQILTTVTTFSVLVPILYLGYKRSLLKVDFIKMIFIYSIVSGLTDLTTYILKKFQISTMLILNLYAVVELLILTLLFCELMPRKKSFLYGTAFLFGGFFILDSVLWEPITAQFQANVLMIESLVVTLFCVVYYFHILGMDASIDAVYKFGLFIILLSLVANFMTSGLLFTYSQYAKLTPTDQLAILFVNCMLNIAKNIGFVIGVVTLGEADAPRLHLGSMLLADKVRKPTDNRRWN